MSDSIEYRIDDKAVEHAFVLALSKQDPLLSRALHHVGEVVRDEAKRRAPRGNRPAHGKHLVDTIVSKVLANRVVVRTSKRYAGIQEYGGTTGPHTITARKAQALAFGGMVVKSVHHPGGTIKAKHFFFGAFEAKKHQVQNIIERAVDDSVRSFK